MKEVKKEPFNVKTLKIVLEKEIEARSAIYCADQVLATHQQGKKLSIAKYINPQVIENMLERIISKLGGSSLEHGMVFVSVKDKNGSFVTSNNDCEKIIISVAFGQELIIKNREYPLKENGTERVVESDDKPANKAGLGNHHISAKQVQLVKELKRKLDELWRNRKGLGVDFNDPGALRIELVQDSPRITKIVQEIGEGRLGIRIDQKSGIIKVYIGNIIYLKWEIPNGD